MGIDKASGRKTATYRNALYVGQFRCGLAEIQDENRKWGYIDTSGTKVFPAEYEFCHSFDHGMAVVEELNEQYSVIDLSGEKLLDGLAKCTQISYGSCITLSRQGSEYCIFNGLSSKRIDLKIEKAYSDGFVRGFAIFEGKMDGGMALIHVSGEQVPTRPHPQGKILDISHPVDGRYACVEEIDGKATVYLWRVGKSTPIKSYEGYDGVIVFPNGFLALQRDGAWGIFSDSGTEILPPQFFWVTQCDVPGVFPYGDMHAMKGFITRVRGKGSEYKWVIGKPVYTSFEDIGCGLFICHGESDEDPIIKEF